MARSLKYMRVADRVRELHGVDFRTYLLRNINEQGRTVTSVAADLGISRKRLYDYAARNEIELGSRVVAVDLRAIRMERARREAAVEHQRMLAEAGRLADEIEAAEAA